MTEVVIITGWRRPDFLAACFQRLEAAYDGGQHFLVSLDRRHDRKCADVANEWIRRMGGPQRVTLVGRHHSYQGNSYNTLTAYAEALAKNPTLVHLVEEDIFVADDYFEYHRGAHALIPNAFSVSGARNQNFPNDPEPEPGAIYLNVAYQSVAVSFRPEILRTILPHATRQYFRDPIGYCKRTFPHTRIPAGNAEQDGLINRIAESGGFRTVYPTVPVAYHAGFVGYHRKGEPALVPGKAIKVAAQQLLEMDAAEMNRRAHSYPDHQWVDVRAKHTPPNRLIDWPVLP